MFPEVKIMLGISIYLKEELVEQNGQWIKKASENGMKSIFTSLHIPEDNPATYKVLLRELGSLAKEFKLELLADVSPASLGHLGLDFSKLDELIAWGLSGIRVDYGFTANEIVLLSNKMKIGINASTVSDLELREWIKKGLNVENVEAWHNFYPRPETGLDEEFLKERNLYFRKIGITTMAFIPGDGQLRAPVHQGLPTLEKHRGISPVVAAAELLSSCFTDKVLIGDHTVSDETLESLKMLAEGIVPLRVQLLRHEDRDILQKIHTNRMDPARDVIRSVESRSYAQFGNAEIQPKNQLDRRIGAVTIDNHLYGRYAGEIQIAINHLPQDDNVNVLGFIIKEDLPLLAHIKAGTKFQLIARD
jgi:uncharacterized protein